MARSARRDLQTEIEKHFRGTPAERVELALRLGRQALDAFRATLPPGTTRQQARAILQRNKNRGRRPCRVLREIDA
jgi:hypothetical protein